VVTGRHERLAPVSASVQVRAMHRFACRVYYEDTDLAGIVYYANYLRFIERARTEWVRGLGVDQGRLRAEQGIVFAVRRVAADYLAPARFDDLLDITTAARQVTGARIVLQQDVWCGVRRLFVAEVTLAALAADGRPARLPPDLRARLSAA
jgi:acyl-CoA thioester hydrolase